MHYEAIFNEITSALKHSKIPIFKKKVPNI